MYAALHRHYGHTVNFSNYQPSRMTLRRRTHESRYLFIRDRDRLIKVVGKATQTTA
jgi:hypothetical protein